MITKMIAPVYLVCAALAVATRGEENIPSYFTKQVDSQQKVQDPQMASVDLFKDASMEYFLPRLMAKYRPYREWNPRYIDPRLLQLAEIESNNLLDQVPFIPPEGRSKRTSIQGERPSLSIVNSLDVLRNRLLLEISRKKAMEGVNRNRDLLCKIGKRATVINGKICEDEFID